MNNRNPSTILDPYCSYCKRYKGIGPCVNKMCSGPNSHQDVTRGVGVSCQMCDRPAEVICDRCGNGFCEIHSNLKESDKLENFTQSIATCSSCRKYVCDRCWIIDEHGMIICRHHLKS